MKGVTAVLLFVATIPAANWMILHVGACSPAGPCLVPVWPGILAPSGVLLAGLALVLRDVVHEEIGRRGAWAAILAGAVLSLAVSAPALAIASGAAFLISEAFDLFVYERLRARGLVTAVAASSLVGAVIDSAAFLLIAFGSLDYVIGQVIGKSWAVAAAVLAVSSWRAARG